MHPGSRDPCSLRPEMLRVFWYIDMLTCVIYNGKQMDDWSYFEEDREVNVQAQTWYKMDSAYWRLAIIDSTLATP